MAAPIALGTSHKEKPLESTLLGIGRVFALVGFILLGAFILLLLSWVTGWPTGGPPGWRSCADTITLTAPNWPATRAARSPGHSPDNLLHRPVTSPRPRASRPRTAVGGLLLGNTRAHFLGLKLPTGPSEVQPAPT